MRKIYTALFVLLNLLVGLGRGYAVSCGGYQKTFNVRQEGKPVILETALVANNRDSLEKRTYVEVDSTFRHGVEGTERRLHSVVQAIGGDIDTSLSIEGVRVVGHRIKEIITPQRLEGATLKRLNMLSVADALRFFSGVQIKDYGGIGGLKTINIRSMGSEHVGVYYDGLQLGNAQNGQVDLGKYSMDNVEVISLYNGQKSEIFQGAKDFGAAGTIYIETRRPHFEKGKSTNFRVGAKVGSFGLLNFSTLVEHKLGSRISASMNAEWTHAHGHYRFRYKRRNIDWSIAYDTTAIRQNSDVNAVRVEGGVYGILPGGNWKVRLYHYSSERGLPGAIVNNVWRRGERMWDRNSFIQGFIRSDVTGWYRVQASVKYAYDFLHYVNKDQRMLQVDNSYRQQEAYGSVANLFVPFEWWELSLSYDFQWNTLVNRNEASDLPMYDFPFPTRYSNYVSAATAFEKWGVKLQASVLGVFVLNRVLSAGGSVGLDACCFSFLHALGAVGLESSRLLEAFVADANVQRLILH